jgi:hypothetical protein
MENTEKPQSFEEQAKAYENRFGPGNVAMAIGSLLERFPDTAALQTRLADPGCDKRLSDALRSELEQRFKELGDITGTSMDFYRELTKYFRERLPDCLRTRDTKRVERVVKRVDQRMADFLRAYYQGR